MWHWKCLADKIEVVKKCLPFCRWAEGDGSVPERVVEEREENLTQKFRWLLLIVEMRFVE
jgi:hypothetical protein